MGRVLQAWEQKASTEPHTVPENASSPKWPVLERPALGGSVCACHTRWDAPPHSTSFPVCPSIITRDAGCPGTRARHAYRPWKNYRPPVPPAAPVLLGRFDARFRAQLSFMARQTGRLCGRTQRFSSLRLCRGAAWGAAGGGRRPLRAVKPAWVQEAEFDVEWTRPALPPGRNECRPPMREAPGFHRPGTVDLSKRSHPFSVEVDCSIPQFQRFHRAPRPERLAERGLEALSAPAASPTRL